MHPLLSSEPVMESTFETAISNIEAESGTLTYRGYDIHALTERSLYEEVAYLLLYGELPDAEELATFIDDLTINRELPAELLDVIERIPSGAHMMDVLRIAVAFLGTCDPEAQAVTREALFRKSLRTIAVMPAVIAASYRIAQGKDPIHPMPRMTHAQNFLYMLSGYGPDEDAVTALDSVLILYAEHAYALSSFAARTTASSATDYHSAITTAISSLKGRLHGGAHEIAMRVLKNVRDRTSIEQQETDLVKQVERFLTGRRGKNDAADARLTIMKKLSSVLAEKTGDRRWHDVSEKIEEIMRGEQERERQHAIYFYTASLLHMLGFPAELAIPVFAAARIAGWSAHVIEQLENNSILRGRFTYQGSKNLHYQPIERRHRTLRLKSA